MLQNAWLSYASINLNAIVQGLSNLSQDGGVKHGSYTVNSNNEIYYAYSALEPENVERLYAHRSLFLAKINTNGNVEFDRLKVFDQYDFNEGFEKCYSNNNYIIILAGLQLRGAVIGIYNIDDNKINVINIGKIRFFDVTGAFDRQGDFHIICDHNSRYLKLEKGKNYQVSINNKIEESLGTAFKDIFCGENKCSVLPSQQSMIWNNKFVTIYYISTFVKRGDPIRKGMDGFLDLKDKIGIQTFNIDNYKIDDFRIISIKESAIEKIENVIYPEIKIYQPNFDDFPIIYLGGQEQEKNYLYKIPLNRDFKPEQNKNIKIKNYMNKIPDLKLTIYDFAVTPKLVNGKFYPRSQYFHFIGYDRDSDSYYYNRIDKNIEK